jgi:hypothetical protein
MSPACETSKGAVGVEEGVGTGVGLGGDGGVGVLTGEMSESGVETGESVAEAWSVIHTLHPSAAMTAITAMVSPTTTDR